MFTVPAQDLHGHRSVARAETMNGWRVPHAPTNRGGRSTRFTARCSSGARAILPSAVLWPDPSLDAMFSHPSAPSSPALSDLAESPVIRRVLLGVALLAGLHYGRPLADTLNPFALGDGRLLFELAVKADLSATADCRSDACTVATVAPDVAPARATDIRWLPAPVARHPWPSRPKYPRSLPAEYSDEWIAINQQLDPSQPNAGWKLRLGSNQGGLHYAMIDVDAAGYMARLVFAEGTGIAPLTYEAHSGAQARRDLRDQRDGEALRAWRQAGNGRKANGRIDYDAEPPAHLFEPSTAIDANEHSPEGLEFQPVAMPMILALRPDMIGRVSDGDPATLRLSAPRGFSPDIEVAGKIVGRRDDTVLFEADDKSGWWLRNYFSKTRGRTPASDRLSLLVRESLGGRPGEAVRVPETALVRPGAQGAAAGDEAVVWVIVEGAAAPVHVRVGSADGRFVQVNEIESVPSGAIRPGDWRAMPIEQRARFHRVQAPRQATGKNLLLHKDARVVLTPDPSLRAGDPMRSR